MVLVDIGSRVLVSAVRTLDRRLAQGSVANARIAVEANQRRSRWVPPEMARTELVADPPRSA